MANKTPFRLEDDCVIFRRPTHNGAIDRHVIGRIVEGTFFPETPANWGGKSIEHLADIHARAAEWIGRRQA